MQTSGDILTLHLFTWTSAAFIVAFLLLPGRRGYLLYLAAGFLCVTLILLSTGVFRWVLSVIMPLMFIMAFVVGIGEMKERVQQLREEQREREEAFAEYQLALTKQED